MPSTIANNFVYAHIVTIVDEDGNIRTDTVNAKYHMWTEGGAVQFHLSDGIAYSIKPKPGDRVTVERGEVIGER